MWVVHGGVWLKECVVFCEYLTVTACATECCLISLAYMPYVVSCNCKLQL